MAPSDTLRDSRVSRLETSAHSVLRSTRRELRTMGSSQPRIMKVCGEPGSMITKEHILSEIRRTASANGGAPHRLVRFLAETGIKSSELHGKFWARRRGAL